MGDDWAGAGTAGGSGEEGTPDALGRPAVLGLPKRAWPGPCRSLARGGSATRREFLGAGDPRFRTPDYDYLSHAYYRPDAARPTLVIAQSRLRAGRAARTVRTGGAHPALQGLIRARSRARPGRSQEPGGGPGFPPPPGTPLPEHPLGERPWRFSVEGVSVAGATLAWPDARIAHVRFDWRGTWQVEIAAWDHPLDPDFFASLAVIAQPPTP